MKFLTNIINIISKAEAIFKYVDGFDTLFTKGKIIVKHLKAMQNELQLVSPDGKQVTLIENEAKEVKKDQK